MPEEEELERLDEEKEPYCEGIIEDVGGCC